MTQKLYRCASRSAAIRSSALAEQPREFSLQPQGTYRIGVLPTRYRCTGNLVKHLKTTTQKVNSLDCVVLPNNLACSFEVAIGLRFSDPPFVLRKLVDVASRSGLTKKLHENVDPAVYFRH